MWQFLVETSEQAVQQQFLVEASEQTIHPGMWSQ